MFASLAWFKSALLLALAEADVVGVEQVLHGCSPGLVCGSVGLPQRPPVIQGL
jgi:hypothetical protein